MTFTIGENVGPYRITDQLGQGGMATVYRAYHPNLDRYVAIKVLHAAFKQDPNFLARFRREAQIIAKLEHPGIVPIYDYSEHNGEPYLVMKFIEGETLKARLAKRYLTLDETLKIMTSVAQALTYAHDHGILHRDIKPSNILLEKGTEPYIADFGLARIASAGESTLSQDTMLGTPQYMSPEQAQGIQDLDASTDIYSLGVVLYELVVGRVPFNADTPYAIVHDHIFTPLPLPSKVNPQVPASVERVLLKTLAKERADRYASAVDMIDAFREAVREADLKELSAGSYRVPITPPTTGTPRSTEAPVPTPPPVGVPSPYPASLPGLTTSSARLYAQQRRRASLWMLGGFAGLIATCLVGLFVTISAFSDASIRASLFVPRPSSIPQTENPQSPATKPPIAPATRPPTVPTTKPVGGILGIASQDEAEKRIKDQPTDPVGHFALTFFLFQDKGPINAIRGQQELFRGIALAKDDPALLMQVAQFSAKSSDVPNIIAATLYAAAYGVGANNNEAIRREAGQYLYKFAQGKRRREAIYLERMTGIASETKSAGVFAFVALAQQNNDQVDRAKENMSKALDLDAKLAEVRLVQGILFTVQNEDDKARAEFDAVSAAPNVPNWIVDEAKKLAKKES